jgi:hypothetical protein
MTFIFMLSSGHRFSLSRLASRTSSRSTQQRRRYLSSEQKPKPGWKDPGTLSIWLGWSIIGLLCIDQGLQRFQSKQRKDFLKDVEAYHDPPGDADKYEWLTKPTLYTRVIQKVPDTDGYKCLNNVKAGDVVEVIEEKAGPEDEYSVCRIESESGEISTGWFPTSYLGEVKVAEKPKAKKPWYKFRS